MIVWPFRLLAPAVVEDDDELLSLLPPQAETTRATMTATSHGAVASFLRMLLSSCAKTILVRSLPS